MVTLQNHSQSKKKIGSSPKLHAENEVVYHQNSVKLVSTRRHLSHLGTLQLDSEMIVMAFKIDLIHGLRIPEIVLH